MGHQFIRLDLDTSEAGVYLSAPYFPPVPLRHSTVLALEILEVSEGDPLVFAILHNIS